MSERLRRRDRVHELLDLARAYRGWTRLQLARAMQRDPSRLYPESDNPRLDFLMSLADVLEWPMDAVCEFVWSGVSPTPAPHHANGNGHGKEFDALFAEQRAAHLAGDYERALQLVRQLHVVAATGEQRARTWNRESLTWESLGRYTRAHDALSRGLQERDVSTPERLALRSNLANVCFGLWDLEAARGLSTALIDWFDDHPPEDLRGRVCHAFSLYVRGQTARRLMRIEFDHAQECALRSVEDLSAAAEKYELLAAQFDRRDLAAVAHTCRVAAFEGEVALGRRAAESAITVAVESMMALGDPTEATDGEWLESQGWTALVGANIALETLSGGQLQRTMALLLGKLAEIADFKGNWAFRERALTLEHMTRRKLREDCDLEIPLILEDEDVRRIAGVMGRFPRFRRVGWELLRDARLVRGARAN